MGRKSNIIKKILRNNKVTSDGFEYVYTLFENESDKVASYRLSLYSIKIEMTDSDGKYSYAEVNDVFCDVGKAILFYEMLIKNLATPIDLPYILEDKISI